MKHERESDQLIDRDKIFHKQGLDNLSLQITFAFLLSPQYATIEMIEPPLFFVDFTLVFHKSDKNTSTKDSEGKNVLWF